MIGFVEYLISRGYQLYRKESLKKDQFLYNKDSNVGFYSSTLGGYVDIRLRKDNKEIVYGLHEKGHPPTLIYPRPKGIIYDVDMDRIFLNFTYEEILQMIEEEFI